MRIISRTAITEIGMHKAGDIVKNIILFISAAAVLILFYSIAGCPIRLLTGVSCPGCGMTRAWLRVLSLDFPGAFRFHPLWPVPLIVIVLYLRLYKKNPKAWNTVLYAAFLLFAATYIIRIYMHSPVIVIQPREGLLLRVINKIFR